MLKPVTAVAAVLVVPVAMLSGCSSNESSNNKTTTTSPSGTAAPAGTERLTTQLKKADGTPVADATLDFKDGFATVTVQTVAAGLLKPGFHGMHIHSVGKCEGDFKSAGGHYQAPGHEGQPASGDLTSLEVRSDGSAKLVTTTDAFTAADLLAGEKTALMIHEGSDNFGNIPPRYTINGTPGPDQETLSTGDAGGRVACGVIHRVGATPTTSTTTVTAPAAPAAPATTTVTSAPASETSPTGTTGSTSTETVTSVPPTTTSSASTVPGQPGG